MIEYRWQPGLQGIDVEGQPPRGLRYRFEDNACARRFMMLRKLQGNHEHDRSRSLTFEGRYVVELWNAQPSTR